MTDKQIIIDVTQCPYYKEDKTCTYLPYKSKCEGDCNWTAYKEMEEKFKRKEQECKELKEEAIKRSKELIRIRKERQEGQKMNRNLHKQLDQLKAENKELKAVHSTNVALSDELFKYKAENERLKKEIRLYNCIDKWGTEQCHCAYRCLGNDFCNEADKKINKLKQTLTEIKEIAEKNLNIHTCAFKGCGYDLITKQILQKISECEGNDE